MPLYELDGKRPRVHPDAWIAPTAVVIGDVEVKARASIWFGAILRGDESRIVIGEGANVQDGTMIHCTYELPTVIAANASIGHMCCLEGCQVEEGALVGTGSTMLQRSRVGKRAMLAAGSVLAEGAEVPDGHLAAGIPAVVKKELAGSSLRWISRPGPHYVEHSRLYRETLRLIPAELRLRAPAKLNLDLKVRGVLPNGRHELESTVQAIDLCDELELVATSGVRVTGFAVPTDEANLAVKAMLACGWNGGLALRKVIPPGSGLGGASSDAAAILRHLGRPDLASSLGADVTFFLRGGRQRMAGAGERLRSLPDVDAWYAIAWPGYEIGTAAVYAKYDEVGGEGRNHLFRAACAVEPRLAEFAARLGPAWTMTGTGSGFFRECASKADAEAALADVDAWTAVARSVGAWDGQPSGAP